LDNGHEDPAPAANGGSAPPVRELLGGQLLQVQVDRVVLVAAVTVRDDRIDELNALLEQARDDMAARQEAVDNAWIEMTALREARDEALNACREALRLAHPDVPPDLIRGETVEELSASVTSAKNLVEKVRAALKAEKDAVRVPAGAPVDAGPDLDGLSPRDKIAAGVGRTK
jgi:uncharacterized coiled-coil protein SlyX